MFIHHSPKAESTWDKGNNLVLTLHLAQCWPGTLRPRRLRGHCWQMVSPNPASVSPLAEWSDDGLTSSTKCFVKASFSFSSGSADFWKVEILSFSAVPAAPLICCLQLDPSCWASRATLRAGNFLCFPPICSLAPGTRGLQSSLRVPRVHLAERTAKSAHSGTLLQQSPLLPLDSESCVQAESRRGEGEHGQGAGVLRQVRHHPTREHRSATPL